MAIFYKGEDVILTFQSTEDMSGFNKVVKFFTPYSTPKTATIVGVNNNVFTAKLASADTAALPTGTLNIVLEFTSSNGKIITKTVRAKLADAYLDGGDRGSGDVPITQVSFNNNQVLNISFTTHSVVVAEAVNAATAAAASASSASGSASAASASATAAAASAAEAAATVTRLPLTVEGKATEVMTKATPVYISDANGANPLLSKASNTTEGKSSKVVGLLAQNLAINGIGVAIKEGLLDNIGTGTAVAGDAVWLGDGVLIYGLTNKPKAPLHLVYLGIVVRAHATNGAILVSVQNGFEIEELHNVLIANLQDGDAIQYDLASGLYKNKAIAQSIGLGNTSTTSQKLLTDKILQLFNANNFTTQASNSWIGSDGNLISVSPSAIVRKMPVIAGQKYIIRNLCPAVSTIQRQSYAFYSSFSTITSSTYISGSGMVAGDLVTCEEITIPTNCIALVVSDNPTSYVAVARLEGLLTTLDLLPTLAVLKADLATGLGNSTSLTLSQNAISSILEVVNMTTLFPLSAGNYYTLQTAISAIPSYLQKLGMKIVFAASSLSWKTYIFGGSSLSYIAKVGEWIDETLLDADSVKISPPILTTYNNKAVGSTGALIDLAIGWNVKSFSVIAGDTINIQSSLDSSGSANKRIYAFYNNTIDVNGFISGSTSSTGELSTNEVVTVPSNANILCVSTGSNHVNSVGIVSKLNTHIATLLDISSRNQPVFSSSSIWGILGNNQGALKSEFEQAFDKCYAKEQIYVGYVDYKVSTPYRIDFFRLFDNSLYGSIMVNPLDTSYRILPIYDTYTTNISDIIVGYVIIKGSAILRQMLGLYSSKPIFNLKVNEYETFMLQNKTTNVINCIGDSLTAIGSGYSSYLNIPSYINITLGSGGETSLQILGRTGHIPYEVSEDLTIPTTTTAVNIKLRSSWNKTATFPRLDFAINPCVIRGIKGIITITSAGASCTFTRLTAGTVVSVKVGEKVITNNIQISNNYINIVWVGQNGGFTNTDDLVSQFQAVADKTNSKFLFITPHLNTTDELELKMSQRFGNKYLNMREWCVKYGLEESGITATQSDLDAISLGNCPPSLLGDGVHFVTSAKQAQALLIQRKLTELNFVK